MMAGERSCIVSRASRSSCLFSFFELGRDMEWADLFV